MISRVVLVYILRAALLRQSQLVKNPGSPSNASNARIAHLRDADWAVKSQALARTISWKMTEHLLVKAVECTFNAQYLLR